MFVTATIFTTPGTLQSGLDQVQTYGYTLKGWPLTSKFHSPSDIGSASNLQAVWDTLEKDELREAIEAAVEHGECEGLKWHGKGKKVAAKLSEKQKQKATWKVSGGKPAKTLNKLCVVLSSDNDENDSDENNSDSDEEEEEENGTQE
ncbi:hypothetical protein K439DRAFT_1618596 [Ramaria rubella]|nr:hypothetical protein K439DRAFT_1618596 [Ramaria rubella]